MENNKNSFSTERKLSDPESFVGELEYVDRSRQDDYELFEQEKNEALRLAYVDKQTDCYNRNYYERLTERLDYDKYDGDIIFILIDINDLGLVNNEQSYGAGDNLIKNMSIQLRNQLDVSPIANKIDFSELEKGDTIPVRIGGDEFAVIRLKTEQEKNDPNFETNFDDAIGAKIYERKPKGLNFAWGFTTFNKDFDKDFYDTRNRAGIVMHEQKRAMKGLENNSPY